MAPEKTPYTPSSNKRFEISEDQFSRERIRALTEVYKELKETFPSIGFSLYGSLTKGKVLNEHAKEVSDIDFAVYLDKDELLGNREWLVKALENTAIPRAVVIRENLDLATAEALLRFCIEYKLSQKLNLDSMGQLMDTRVYALSKTEDEFDELYQKHGLAESGQPGGSRALSKMFRLDVGGGMKSWRRFVFDQLAHHDAADRERIWSEIDATIREHERKSDVPAKIEKQFPKSFEEAKQYYTR